MNTDFNGKARESWEKFMSALKAYKTAFPKNYTIGSLDIEINFNQWIKVIICGPAECQHLYKWLRELS